MDIQIKRFEPGLAPMWNTFTATARNATFLFDRNFMDYHADRFDDCSFMAFKGNRLLAVLPANITADGTLHSHGGLTYGGWALAPAHTDAATVMQIFGHAVTVWQSSGIKALDYKPLPYIYADRPSQEDLYALFRLGARQTQCNLSVAVQPGLPNLYNQQQKRHLKQALATGVSITETDDAAVVMTLTADCLEQRHDARPVHSAAQMQLLKNRFPANIRFFTANLDGTPHAAVCIFDTGRVAHAQYIATTPAGRAQNLLAALFDHLLTKTFAGRAWFDFGTSNLDGGRILNTGLIRQKCSFGATGVACTRWHLDL